MSEPSFPWDDSQKSINSVKKVPIQIKSPGNTTTGASNKVDSYEPEKKYGTGKPYRIEIKGDITSDSRKRGE